MPGRTGPEGTYSLYAYAAGGKFCSLLPPGGNPGDESFIFPDGTFQRCGPVSEDEAAAVIATYTPTKMMVT
jgi:hypothetical protein